MNKRAFLATLAVGCSLLAVAPLARATSNYTYKRAEYVVIKRGLSPDGSYSIAAHGDGELGYDHFNIHLLDAKTGKRLGALTEITKGSWFDTAAGAYHATWSADSRFVTVSYRSDRHTISAVKYRVEKGRALHVSGPKPQSDRESAALGWPDPN